MKQMKRKPSKRQIRAIKAKGKRVLSKEKNVLKDVQKAEDLTRQAITATKKENREIKKLK